MNNKTLLKNYLKAKMVPKKDKKRSKQKRNIHDSIYAGLYSLFLF